ncbi:MAG TPA: hypothetical protein VN823_01575 [Stellaceae bacterium]|nr:hypothetical protein [Stellaceae bacterium]
MDIPIDYLAGRWLSVSDRPAGDPSQSCGSRLERRFLDADPAQQYCLFTPSTPRPRPPILVVVPGTSQSAADQVRSFVPLAEAAGTLVVAPVFARERFPHYQRLGRAGHGLRADRALDEILRDVRALNPGCADRTHFFGHSGGGQFVHRYVMARPNEVERYVVSAAGGYTLPDPHLNFPFGIRQSPDLPGFAPDPRAFLAVPGCVFGRAHGQHPGRGLSRMLRSDPEPGVARIDRGRRWAAVMNRKATSLGLSPPIQFSVLPVDGPVFGGTSRPSRLAAAAFDFLFRARERDTATQSQ